jgi:hypothetical protein
VDTTASAGRLMLTVLSGIAEFERDLILQRTNEGRARAKAEGTRFGCKPNLTKHQARAPTTSITDHSSAQGTLRCRGLRAGDSLIGRGRAGRESRALPSHSIDRILNLWVSTEFWWLTASAHKARGAQSDSPWPIRRYTTRRKPAEPRKTDEPRPTLAGRLAL